MPEIGTMDDCFISGGIPAIQKNSDLSQGLSPRLAAQSSVRAAGIDAVFERKEAEIEFPATPV
jgi:hypothetical protein